MNIVLNFQIFPVFFSFRLKMCIYMLSAKVREVVCEMIGAFIRIYFTFYFFILAFYSKVTSQKIVLIVGF